MGDPLFHAESSARLFGGIPDDYIHMHTIMDSSKLFLADWRHRALLHNTFGIHMFEQFMGPSFKRKSDGKDVCTRTVISQHIMEDMNAIPTPGEFLREMPVKSWMAGISPTTKKRMQAMTIDGNGNNEAYISETIKWIHVDTELPKYPGMYIVCDDKGNITTCTYSSNWDPACYIKIKYWAEDIKGPIAHTD